jgi:hypothetical protein
VDTAPSTKYAAIWPLTWLAESEALIAFGAFDVQT